MTVERRPCPINLRCSCQQPGCRPKVKVGVKVRQRARQRPRLSQHFVWPHQSSTAVSSCQVAIFAQMFWKVIWQPSNRKTNKRKSLLHLAKLSGEQCGGTEPSHFFQLLPVCRPRRNSCVSHTCLCWLIPIRTTVDCRRSSLVTAVSSFSSHSGSGTLWSPATERGKWPVTAGSRVGKTMCKKYSSEHVKHTYEKWRAGLWCKNALSQI